MRSEDYGMRLALGALAGLAGAVFIRGGMLATQRWMPQTLPPMKEDPGEYMVHKMEKALPRRTRAKMPEAAERTAAQALALGYGVTFGTLYSSLPRAHRDVLWDGTILGVVTWAAGYLGWLPAIGLTPPVWRQETKQIVPNILSHACFGIVTVAALRRLEKTV